VTQSTRRRWLDVDAGKRDQERFAVVDQVAALPANQVPGDRQPETGPTLSIERDEPIEGA
jgi:hypothetical protein